MNNQNRKAGHRKRREAPVSSLSVATDVASRIAAARTLEHICDSLLDEAVALAGATCAEVLLRDPETRQLPAWPIAAPSLGAAPSWTASVWAPGSFS